MKTRLIVDVDARERYVIAKYFAAADGSKRTRATREQVRKFVVAAVRSMVDERARALRGRERAIELRLRNRDDKRERLARPSEQQPSFL